MFYSSDLLGKRSPLGAVWMTAHGKRLAKKNILSVSVSDTCDAIMDPTVPHALRLQAVLVGGLVLIHSKQTLYILEDAEASFRQLLALAAAGGGVLGGDGGATLLPAEGGGAAITLPAASLAGLAAGNAVAALAALAAAAGGGLGGLAVPGAAGGGGGGASQLFGSLTLGTQAGGAGGAGGGGAPSGGRPSGGGPLLGGAGVEEDMFLMPATAAVSDGGHGGPPAAVTGILDRLAGAASPGGALAAAARGEFGGAVAGGGGGLAYDGYWAGDGLMEAPPGGDMDGLLAMMDGGAGGLGEWGEAPGVAGEEARQHPLEEGGGEAPALPPAASAALAGLKRAPARLDVAGSALPNKVIRAWIADPAPILVPGAGGRAGRGALGGGGGGGGGGGPATTTHGRSSAAALLAAAPLAVPAPDTGAWPDPLASLLRGAMMKEGGVAGGVPKPARAAAKRRKVGAAEHGSGVDWGDVGPPLPLEDGGGLATAEWGGVGAGAGGSYAPWMAAPDAGAAPPPGGAERLRHALLGAELAGPLAAAAAAEGRGSPGSSGRLAPGAGQRGSGSGPAGSGDRPPSDGARGGGAGEPRPAASSGEAAAAVAAMAALAEGGDIFLPAVPEEEGEGEVEGGRADGGGGGGAAAFHAAEAGVAAAAAAAAVAARKAAALNPATRNVLTLLRARFAAQAQLGAPQAVSLGTAAAALGSRSEAARLFFQATVGVTAGFLRAAQPDGPWTDITLTPGPAMRGVGAVGA